MAFVGAVLNGAEQEADGDSASNNCLAPIYAVETSDGGVRLEAAMPAGAPEQRPGKPLFYAVLSQHWPAGLVGLYSIKGESEGGLELRRRPLRGRENWTEPLFFAEPLEEEEAAKKLAGRWDCRALRDGSTQYLAWDLTMDGEHVVGRLDQNTDYRFAHVVGGTFRSNRFEMRIEYIMDSYLLNGVWENGKMSGEWHRTDGGESGTWQASRFSQECVTSGKTIGLYEARRSSDGARRYVLEGTILGPEWDQRIPLCRVWRELQ